MSAETIATIWADLIAFAVLAYVVLDGFDLGVGILFAAERGSSDRDTMVNTIAPMWDGNETWLVLGAPASSPCFRLPMRSLCRPFILLSWACCSG